jgi:hypothetical protein
MVYVGYDSISDVHVQMIMADGVTYYNLAILSIRDVMLRAYRELESMILHYLAVA